MENIVGKGENADYQHFLLLPQYLLKASSFGQWKQRIVWQRVHKLHAFVVTMIDKLTRDHGPMGG